MSRRRILLDSQDSDNDPAYGVEWDITDPSPLCTRIGNMQLHKTLPVQSLYRGCICNPDNPSVIEKYLNPNDWTKEVKDNKYKIIRVHTPKFYGRSWEEGNKRRVMISLQCIDDTWQEIPEMVIDACRSMLDRRTAKLAGYMGITEPDYRGGDGDSSYDSYLEEDDFKTLLNKPKTNLSRKSAREYANKAGSELLCYEYYKWIFYWAYVIEYANFNSQAPYNANLTSEGYHQGGLGDGVTNVNNWSDFNNTNPITPCGYLNNLGNGTGVKVITSKELMPVAQVRACKWRGFENPFGDIWTNLDGIIVSANNVYTTTDSAKFSDSINDSYILRATIDSSSGYIKTFYLGSRGDIIPGTTGGSASTYKCDYCYVSLATATLLVGGGADFGGDAGLACWYSCDGVGDSYAGVGFRTLNKIVR